MPLDEQEEAVQDVTEQAEEDDPAVHPRQVEVALLLEDGVAEAVGCPRQLGDDDEHEPDRQRHAAPRRDRGERRGQVDAVEPLDRPDVQHRRRVACLGRDAAHALGRVHEDREEDAEGDHRDEHRVAEPEDDDRDGHDRDRRHGAQQLEQRLEHATDANRAADEEPDGDARAGADAEAGREPGQARLHVREELSRRPDVPRPLGDGARRRYEERRLGARPDLPDRERREQEGRAEQPPSAHGEPARSSPAQKTARRCAARSPTLTA